MNAPTGVGALSDETRAKLSAISKAKWQDPEYVAHRRANPGGVASKLSPEERERRRQQKERNRAIRARHLKIAARRRVERESLKTLTPLMCQGKVMLPVGRNGNGASHRQAKNARSFFWFAIEPALWETVKGHLWHVKTNVTGNATYYSPRATIDGAKVAIGTIARRLGIDGPTPMRHGVTPDCSAKMHVST